VTACPHSALPVSDAGEPRRTESRTLCGMADPSEPWRHHYVHQFYISNWAGPDGLVWQRSRTPRGTFKDRRLSTRATGFAEDLYTLRSKLPFARQSDPAEIETKVMQKLDDLSAGALQKLVADGVVALDPGEREDWALFMNGLIERAARRLRQRDQRAVEVAGSLTAEHLARMPVERRDRMASLLEPALQAAWANNTVQRTHEEAEHVDLPLRRPCLSRDDVA
jgi:Protein of unknown function (DUF4238)